MFAGTFSRLLGTGADAVFIFDGIISMGRGGGGGGKRALIDLVIKLIEALMSLPIKNN